jgi:hypothetical protein
MEFLLKGIKKASLILSGIILTVLVTVLLLVSPIAKYLIEKYDVKYSGREIKLNRVYINLFTGYIHFAGLKIHEAGSDSIFFSADEVNANVEMHKLFSKVCEFSEVVLVKPVGIISQNKSAFNFDDLIRRFTPTETHAKKNNDRFRVNILNIKIDRGVVCYYERSIPVAYSLKEINIESAGKVWNSDTMEAKFSWLSGIGSGTMKGNIMMNVKSLDYAFSVLASKFDLSILEQYLKDISANGSLRANFDADIKALGNFANAENIDAKGFMTFNDFHFGKNKVEDYASFKKFTVAAKELSPKNKKYAFDSLSLLEPYFKYELYDHLDNLQNMFGKKGEKVTEANAQPVNTNFLFQIAGYVKSLAKNFFKSSYKVNRLAIYKADMHYVDYTLNEKFEVSATPLYVFADSIEHGDKWVDLTFRTNLKPYGTISLDLSINPKDSSDFTIKYHLQQLPVAMFNPYLLTYTSFPMDRGTMELQGSWHVNNGIIQSNNHLTVLDPRINNKQKRKGARWVPLRLAMFFIREQGNVIDYEIPITGNLKNPKFKLNDVFLDALTNLFIKPVTIPYRTEIRNKETEIERSFSLDWEMRKNTLQPHQDKFVKKLMRYLNDYPERSISITPIQYTEKEKEYILLFEAKKLFYMQHNNLKNQLLTENDTITIAKIPTKDSLFVHYLNKHVGKEELFTVQDKCRKLVGPNRVALLFERLCMERKKSFMSAFKEKEISGRVKFKPGINSVPYNGFSYYKIEYRGEWPEDLQQAYNDMAYLNNESPRSKFQRDRKTIPHQ